VKADIPYLELHSVSEEVEKPRDTCRSKAKLGKEGAGNEVTQVLRVTE